MPDPEQRGRFVPHADQAAIFGGRLNRRLERGRFDIPSGEDSFKSITTVGIQETQANLSELLQRAQQCEQLIIADDDTFRVLLVPVTTSEQPRIAGLNRGTIRMHGDFNDPLPDTF